MKNIDKLYHKPFIQEMVDYTNTPEYSLLIHKQMQEIRKKNKDENSND